MNQLSIRVTNRLEIDGRISERTIDIETIPDREERNAFPIMEALNTCAPGINDPGSPSVTRNASAPRFTKVLADGTYAGIGGDSDDHVAVIDHASGLMWSVESLGDPDDADSGITQEHCIERCRELRLLGFDDWRLPTRAELAALIDDTRHEPAIDTNFFPRVKPRWHWTSTPAAWSSASAWGVYFYDGDVNSSRRDSDGFALAVRRAGQ